MAMYQFTRVKKLKFNRGIELLFLVSGGQMLVAFVGLCELLLVLACSVPAQTQQGLFCKLLG